VQTNGFKNSENSVCIGKFSVIHVSLLCAGFECLIVVVLFVHAFTDSGLLDFFSPFKLDHLII